MLGTHFYRTSLYFTIPQIKFEPPINNTKHPKIPAFVHSNHSKFSEIS
jgi:hypothetical protein